LRRQTALRQYMVAASQNEGKWPLRQPRFQG